MDLSSLLKIETDKQIIDYKITTLNIPIWILIRFSFFLYLTTKEHNLTNPHLKISKSKSSFLEKIKYYLLTLCKHPFTNKKVKVLILGSAINNVFDNNNYYNRLYDDFYQILRDNILIIESSDNHRYYEPRFFKNVKYSDIIDLISKKLRKIILKPTFKDIESLESFEKFIIPKIKNLFNIDCNQFI
ncbi:MAG: hypothetical protein NZM44_01165, partial [Candidatus Calescibacterium sp.]|nr:hypothetical protein [Candidatus Calescibacterium sp.]